LRASCAQLPYDIPPNLINDNTKQNVPTRARLGVRILRRIDMRDVSSHNVARFGKSGTPCRAHAHCGNSPFSSGHIRRCAHYVIGKRLFATKGQHYLFLRYVWEVGFPCEHDTIKMRDQLGSRLVKRVERGRRGLTRGGPRRSANQRKEGRDGGDNEIEPAEREVSLRGSRLSYVAACLPVETANLVPRARSTPGRSTLIRI
jgi:hypothetical protein